MKNNNDPSYIFGSMPVKKALMTMALPTIMGQIIVLIYNLADTFFVGRTSDPYMVAGVSLILPLFNTLLALSALTSVGGSTLISRLLGMGNEEMAKRVCTFSVWFGVGMAAVFSLTVGVFIDPLLHLLGAGEHTFLYAKQYTLCVIVCGAVPTVLSSLFSAMLRSSGNSRPAGFGVALGGILNILLDPLFMFVLFPRGWEILGAGVATLLSNVIACIYYAVVIFRLRGRTVVSLRSPLPDKRSVRSIFSIGFPAAFGFLMFDLDYICIDRLMAGYSDISLAAIGIVLKAERLPLNVGIGLCQGMDPIISYNYASGNRERMRRTLRCAVLTGLVIGAVSVTLYELFASDIIRFFINDAATVELGAKFLRARCLATPVMFLSFAALHMFQDTGDGKNAFRLAFLRWLVLNIPFLFILNRLWGVTGIIFSQVTADSINALISWTLYFILFIKAEKAGRGNRI